MNKPKLLSGDELVAKGEAKNSVTLPELGLKDVTPNGSWLEQKQIQSVLEARKQLIEAERIEKCGVLSQAEWNEDLMLAEVTKQTGGYWQFIGHYKDYQLYLKPEEALYLIEVNCLQLKYNGVTVSLQQAYALLLRDKISVMQYKVYASLSRLGYKVFRFVEPTVTSNETKEGPTQKTHEETESYCKNDSTQQIDKEVVEGVKNTEKENQEGIADIEIVQTEESTLMEYNTVNDEENAVNDIQNCAVNSTIDVDLTLTDKCESEVCELSKETETDSTKDAVKIENDVIEIEPSRIDVDCVVETTSKTMDIDQQSESNNQSEDYLNIQPSTSGIHNVYINDDVNSCNPHRRKYLLEKKRILKNKTLLEKRKPKDIHKYFKNIPQMLQKDTVTVKVPTEHIPDHIFPNKTHYEIDLNIVKTRNRLNSNNSNDYSATDESSDVRRNDYSATDESSDARRIGDSSSFSRAQSSQTHFYSSNNRFPRHHFQFNYWRPRHTHNFFPFNFFFQRQFHRNAFFQPPRFQFYPRTPFIRPFGNVPQFNNTFFNGNSNYRPTTSTAPNNNTGFSNATNNDVTSATHSRKRSRHHESREQMDRFICIKRLAFKLKMQRYRTGNRGYLSDLVDTLIKTYNLRYATKIRLTEDFNIDEIDPIETINLDDNDEEKNKKPRLDNTNCDNYDETFSKIKQFAHELKNLVAKDLATPRHRRALSSVVKTFNKSFNADVYISPNYELVDRRYITLDSSSDSDCVIDENNTKKKKAPVGKKLRNPFNVLKRLSEKHKLTSNCSKPDTVVENVIEDTETVSSNENEGDNKYNEFIKKTFSKYWLPQENDFGRAEVPPRSLMLSRIIDSNKQEFLYDFIKNQCCKFSNWVDIKVSFLENLEAAAVLFQSESECESITDLDSIIKPDDCMDMESVLKKLSIISNYKEVYHDTILTIDFDVYNRDIKHFSKNNRPKPHFRIICVEESSNFLPGAEIAALHAKCGDKVPLLFAVVNISSVNYMQINPTDLPIYIPGAETA